MYNGVLGHTGRGWAVYYSNREKALIFKHVGECHKGWDTV